jgi:hypothetical protein
VYSFRKCSLVDILHQVPHADTDIASVASLSAAHVFVSHAFTPALVPPVLSQFSGWLCSLVVALPHKDLERLSGLLSCLEGGAASYDLCYANLTSATAVVPLPPGLACRFTHLTTLPLCNVIPTRKPLNPLSTLTTLSIFSDFQPPVSPGYEYKISDFFELLLCTPQLRHLRLSGIGPSIYDMTHEWVVPLEFLETLHLHHCRLQAKILQHLSISPHTREVSLHTRVLPHDVNTVFHITPKRWQFVPIRVDFYQEG